MAIVREGNNSINANAASGSGTQTVPSGTTLVLAFWSHFDSGAGDGSTLSTLRMDKGGSLTAFTVQEELAVDEVSAFGGVGVATLEDPDTGAGQDYDWAWSAGGARDEGGRLYFIFLSGEAATFLRGTDTDTNSSSTNVSVSLTGLTTGSDADYIGIISQSFDGGNPAIVETVDTVIYDGEITSDQVTDLSEDFADSATETYNITTESWSTMAAIAIVADTAVPATVPLKTLFLRPDIRTLLAR